MKLTPVNDFTFYWTAAGQLLAGQNPSALANPHGFVMLAPPWRFPVTLGFGALLLQFAQFLWLAVSVMALAIAIIWLRNCIPVAKVTVLCTAEVANSSHADRNAAGRSTESPRGSQ